MTDASAPEGFRPHTRHSPVTDAWQPIFARERDGIVELGLKLDARHCNSRGLVHGGVIAALADNAMGLSYRATLRLEEPEVSGSAVTANLALDYIATATAGGWLAVRPRVLRAGKSLGFVDALVTVDGDRIARASAVFMRLGSHSSAST